jgi:hypothetical protein
MMWHTYDQAKILRKSSFRFRVNHINKESNRVADKLAMLARSAGSCIWNDHLPDVIIDLVNQDTTATAIAKP